VLVVVELELLELVVVVPGLVELVVETVDELLVVETVEELEVVEKVEVVELVVLIVV